MSSCIVGREVVIKLRERKTGKLRTAHVVCPSSWTKGRLLGYCRREHPEATVLIEDWKQVASESDRWEIRLWIVNPTEMCSDR
jgi:hypothetical protein